MNITIKIDEVTLDTAVAKVMAYDRDDEEMYATGEQATVGHLVAQQIVERLVKDDQWTSLRDQVMQIRKEEIRAAVRPAIEDALTKPLYKTNTYGERVGHETSTLREIISAEAQKQLAEPADRYHRSEKGTLLQEAVRAEVKRAFTTEITKAVQETATTMIAEQLSGIVSKQVVAAVTVTAK